MVSSQEYSPATMQKMVAHVIQRCILLGFAGTGAGVYLVRFSGIMNLEELTRFLYQLGLAINQHYTRLLTNSIVRQ